MENIMTKDSEERTIFALDIGTRSVIGIVGYQEDDLFHVECVEQEEYKKRAVVDGQIEDIGETAKIAGIVKDRLEARLGRTLRHVHIAAAGRVLRTVEARSEATLEDGKPISTAAVARLEQSAVQKAYDTLFQNEADRDTSFFCVGHAVKNYTLDGYHLSSLVDHKGLNAGAELIATFLPREVVESLYTTMARIGLTVAGLTLEPIAAMNAVIPEDLRKLNLALVDIGAGTSDIALCAGGGVSAYTMATLAGDEITEALMEGCLVDFQTAEQLKKQLSADPETTAVYTDILGFPHTVEGSELCGQIRSAVEALAEEICARIIQTNGKTPAAVFLVGGGSKTPMLCPLVAKGLGIDANRVAVGGNNYMQRMLSSCEMVTGPEFATPAGIALTAARQREGDAFTVTVNNERLRLVDGWDTSVLGVLQLSGYRYSQIMGRAGRSLSFLVNGENRVIRGGLPESATIIRNGTSASLSDMVEPGDALSFSPASPGKDAQVCLSALPEYWPDLPVLVNGAIEEGTYQIQLGDQLSIPYPEEITQPEREPDAEPERPPEPEPPLEPEPQEFQEPEPLPEPVIPHPVSRPLAGIIHITLNSAPLALERRIDGTHYQFFDLLALTDIDPKHPQGNIVQRLNGVPASYLDPIREGDNVEIYWDKRMG